MQKKSFKDNPALAYVTGSQTEDAGQDQEPKSGRKPKGEYYRVCLNLRPEFRQYLDDESWKARQTVTEYVNCLIAADMAAKAARRTEGTP